MSAKNIMGYTPVALAGDNIRHSPQWYRRRCKDEILQPYYLRDWLYADMETCNADSTAGGTDEESITIYEEVYMSNENLKVHAGRIEELMWSEAKSDDRPLYQRHKENIVDEEKYYDDKITEIAKDVLYGKDKSLKTFLNKIKKENIRDKQYNKTDKLRETERINNERTIGEYLNPSALFEWKERTGCDRDYQKEINHHANIQVVLQSVREKIKQIAIEEMVVLDKVNREHANRLEYLLEQTTNNLDEHWINKETMMSISAINEYNKDGARLSAMVNKEDDTRYGDRLERMSDFIKRNTSRDDKGKKTSFDDFD